MSMERVATFETLINRASTLLQQAETNGDMSGLSEALHLLDFLGRRNDRPFTAEEISLLLNGNTEERQASRQLLDQVKARQSPVVRLRRNPVPVPVPQSMSAAAE